MKRKGIILAGGKGTRLAPLTHASTKCLLPIYDKPMIYYPLRKLTEAGIKDIMIVTGTEHSGDITSLLGSGKESGKERLNILAGATPPNLRQAKTTIGKFRKRCSEHRLSMTSNGGRQRGGLLRHS